MYDDLPVIPADRIEAVCKIGQGAACCRFMVGGARGIECAKHDPELFEQINRRVAFGSFSAQGDNCEGLRHDDATA
ncbi:hypothetical protein GFL80_31825 [Rhizobium leguminosarum bv. viciae]|uniref:hypothetical protein n=1 Tax=Rhizobium TaxID=379 RepID=UPI0010321D7D|nr:MULTISPECIES: hypothetical protein [Rhizobium]NKK88739.1 hypothetical protein [Rhizobium leguminosarum bv. viciae]TAY79053.1 hypothetical protein ELH86_08840 [Rhizobium ruizarguesonis]